MQKEGDRHAGRASVANNYDCDGSGSLCATAQSKSNYQQILKVSDWKIELRFYSRSDLENSRIAHANFKALVFRLDIHIATNLQYLKYYWKSSSETYLNTVVTLLNVFKWLKMRPFKESFSFWNMTVTWHQIRQVQQMFQHCVSFTKNCFTKRAVWEGALSWCKIHLSDQGLVFLYKCAAVNITKLERRITG